MAVLQSGLAKSAAVDAYTIDQSLRFDDGDSAKLQRTLSAGDTTEWTFSCWVKRGSNVADGASGSQKIFGAYIDGSNVSDINFSTDDIMDVSEYVGGSTVGRLKTTQLFRDFSAWYHIVVVWDSDNGSSGDRYRLYVNGDRVTAFSTETQPSSAQASATNAAGIHRFGQQDSDEYYDGYIAESYFIDGQALTPSSFGKTDSTTNQWIAKDAVDDLTFGTNGFYLKFGDPITRHTMTSTGTFTVPTGGVTADILVVAGGGGGAGGNSNTRYGGSGAGAGGMLEGSSISLNAGTYTATIGAGGSGGSYGNGTAGSNSVLTETTWGTATAVGGANGTVDNDAGVDGGSGGGGSAFSSGSGGEVIPGGSATQGDSNGLTGYGNDGGSGFKHGPSNWGAGGGGGGAGGAGGNAANEFSPGADGAGRSNSISGSSVTYAKGGAGAATSGGGGGTAGPANTGTGGTAGNGGTNAGGAGGSGIIIVKWGAGFGKDSSGNSNNFTETNLVATDQMKDSPTNNFPTWNPLCYSPYTTFSEGNLKNVGSTASNGGNTVCSFTPPATGKWYWEEHCSNINSTQWPFIGTVDATVYEKVGTWADNNGRPGESESNGGWKIAADGEYETDGGGGTAGGQGFNDTTDVIQFALDHDNGALYYGVNNTWYTPTASSGDPTSGASKTGAVMTWTAGTRSFIPAIQNYNSSALTLNCGQDSSFAGEKTAQGNQDDNEVGDFYYEPPSGYLALCNSNLSDPSIKLPGDHFNTVLYTGNAASRDITDVGFKSDVVWVKMRDGTYAHNLYDSVRGDNERIQPTYSGAQATTADTVSFGNSGGFSLGDDAGDYGVNKSGSTFVAWNWLAGGAPTATNSAGAGATPTAGSVKIDGSNLGSALAGSNPAKKISASTTAGFSIVSYEGNIDPYGVQTIAHGLSEAPELIIIKNLDDAQGWPVGATVFNASWEYVAWLESNGAVYDTGSGMWNDTAPTASVWTVNDAQASAWFEKDYIAYCWHSVEGYSKVGSYEGNNSTDGTFVYCGFKPAMLITKSFSAGQDWTIRDNARSTYNVSAALLEPNDSVAEVTDSWTYIDFVSNGFKLRNNNTQGGNYGTQLFIAFAENPFKYSTAR